MNSKIIVSITTTFSRLDMLYYSIHSLHRQTVLPNVIFVNISHDAYLMDDGIVNVPDWMRLSSLVIVNYVKNIGSYRKLLPALDFATNDDLIVTADDDVIYGKDWLKSMVAEHVNNPDKIICGSAREIKINILGRFQNYANWKKLSTKKQVYIYCP
jgi:cellulose synthase/poly-beta-1,6-N-acetylglucosamine synthase-like glycosyltransferase